MARLKDRPFALLGVNSDGDLARLRPRLEAEQIAWRSFWNGPRGTGGGISRRFGVRGWPTILVIDHTGVIRFKNVRGERMDKAVDELLAAVPAQPAQPAGGDGR